MLPEFSHKIMFPWGQNRMITKRRKTVYADGGDVHMRCGGCGTTDFTAHLKPNLTGSGRLTKLICSLCGKTFLFNDKGETGGTWTFERADARKRELINERPDN